MEDRQEQDDRLVDSVLRGDPRGFAALVARHQRLVAGVAWRSGVRREEIEDVVSEIFIKAYGNLHRYRSDHPFSTWLYRLAANHVIDHFRRGRRERGRTEMPAQIEDPAPDAGERLEERERAALVRVALDSVHPRYREVLTLVYVEGLRVDAVARLLAIPEGTVKTRLMRGREALRKALVRLHPEYFGDRDALS